MKIFGYVFLAAATGGLICGLYQVRARRCCPANRFSPDSDVHKIIKSRPKAAAY